jgi:hypothetical protein
MLKASADSSIVEQLLNFLFEQKNTIPNGLDSRNYSPRLVATKKSSLSRFMTAALYIWRRKMILD